jgi:hypothetical protein
MTTTHSVCPPLCFEIIQHVLGSLIHQPVLVSEHLVGFGYIKQREPFHFIDAIDGIYYQKIRCGLAV